MNWLRTASLRGRHKPRPREDDARQPCEIWETGSAVHSLCLMNVLGASLFPELGGKMWKEGEARVPALKQLRA